MSTVTSAPLPSVDLSAVKGKQQAAWSAGDYAVVGTTLQIVGESLCEALDLRAGERVLDVAAVPRSSASRTKSAKWLPVRNAAWRSRTTRTEARRHDRVLPRTIETRSL